MYQPPSPRDESFLPLVRDLSPDLLIVVAFRILPAPVLTVPPLGSVNLHASLLPRYRGAAPINWAIINGETETGVTTFFLEETVDTGAIIRQKRTAIGENEDAGSLHDRLARLGAETVLESVRLIESGNVPRVAQDHHAASPAPKIFREDCRIRWDMPSERVRNFIRGLAPLPGAFTKHGDRVVKIHRTERRTDSQPLTPGHIRADKRSLEVGTADAPLGIIELQLETRRRMGVEEFLRGHRIRTGERFD